MRAGPFSQPNTLNMKKLTLIVIAMLVAGELHAGWFCNEDQLWQQFEHTIKEERQSTGTWQLIAGGFAIGGIILFTIGTALGSKAKRDGKEQ